MKPTIGLTPPATLSRAAQQLWKSLVVEYAIADIPGRLLVESALSSWDRVQAAQKRIDKEGLTVLDRYAVPKANPLIAVARAERTAMLRALAALRLDIELPHGTPGRPPRT